MPPLIAAVATGALFAASGATVFGLGALASALVVGGTSLALGLITQAMTPKPKTSALTTSGTTVTIRDSIAARRVIYGQTRVGGVLAYRGASAKNKYFHLVLMLAGHKVHAIDEVWLNDYPIPSHHIDANGNVVAGRYYGKVRIRKHLGDDNQAADDALMGEIPEWTEAHRLRGIAYIYMRLEWNVDVFPNGMPDVSAVVRGKEIYDPRTPDEVPRFTTNSILHAYDYVVTKKYGLGEPERVRLANVIASANISDELVQTTEKIWPTSSIDTSLDALFFEGYANMLFLGDCVQIISTGSMPGGLATNTDYFVLPLLFQNTMIIRLCASLEDAQSGVWINITTAGSGAISVMRTKIPRYHGGGVLNTENKVGDNFGELLSAFGGKPNYSGGAFRLKAAAYESPLFELTDRDILSTISVRTKLPANERFNGVKGIYRSILNQDTPTDYPPITSTLYAQQDGEEILRDLDLPFTQRPETAQRLAKIELLKGRQPITARVVCNLRALVVQSGDTIMWTNELCGWDKKVFLVTNFAFSISPGEGNSPVLAVTLDLRETAPAIYDFNFNEERDVDPAPNTNLPDPFNVAVPTGLRFDARGVSTVGGDRFYVIGLRWDAHDDAFVREGGSFELQSKRSDLDNWLPSFFVSGLLTQTEISPSDANAAYDVRIRAVNSFGVKSAWVQLTGIVAGSAGGVTESEDWGSVEGDLDSSEDWGSVEGDLDSSEDWGVL